MCDEPDSCSSHRDCCCPPPNTRLKKPAVLMLLSEEKLHGYAIIERLQELGIDSAEPGGVYRLLRSFEEESLVESEWDTEGKGPAKRIYSLTAEGQERLHAWRQPLRSTADLIDKILVTIK